MGLFKNLRDALTGKSLKDPVKAGLEAPAEITAGPLPPDHVPGGDIAPRIPIIEEAGNLIGELGALKDVTLKPETHARKTLQEMEMTRRGEARVSYMRTEEKVTFGDGQKTSTKRAWINGKEVTDPEAVEKIIARSKRDDDRI